MMFCAEFDCTGTLPKKFKKYSIEMIETFSPCLTGQLCVYWLRHMVFSCWNIINLELILAMHALLCIILFSLAKIAMTQHVVTMRAFTAYYPGKVCCIKINTLERQIVLKITNHSRHRSARCQARFPCINTKHPVYMVPYDTFTGCV